MRGLAPRYMAFLAWAAFAILGGLSGCVAGPDVARSVIGPETYANYAPPDVLVRLGLLMLGFAVVVVPYRLVVRRFRPRASVLWLRKFHRTQWRVFPIEKLLNSGRHWVATPLTVRDRRMTGDMERGSAASAALKALRYLLIFFWIVGTLIYLAGLGDLISRTLQAPKLSIVAEYAFSAVFAGLYLLVGRFIWFGLRRLEARLAYVRLPTNTPDATRQMENFFTQVSRARHPTGSVHIFRMNDGSWQDLVRYAARKSDIVVLDLSEVNEHIVWEISMTFVEKQPESIILAFECDEASGHARADTIVKLEELVGADLVARAQHFEYPAVRKMFAPNETQALGIELRERMLDALDARWPPGTN